MAAKRPPAKRPAAKKAAAKKPAAKRPAAKKPAGRSDAKAGRTALSRVDGARGQREGRGRVQARAKAQSRRRLGGAVAATVVAVGVLYVVAFPAQTLWTQRTATTKAEAEFSDLQAQRLSAKRKADLLTTPAQIEKLAREIYGFQHPGDEVYNVLPGPTEPTGLPTTWPFTGVERALSGG